MHPEPFGSLRCLFGLRLGSGATAAGSIFNDCIGYPQFGHDTALSDIV